MSDYRFPTLPIENYHGFALTIPVLPPSIFESIDGHEEVVKIMARPHWSFDEADARLRPRVRKAMAKLAKASEKDRTKTHPTPKRNGKVAP